MMCLSYPDFEDGASRQPDSTFLKSLCEKYGLGMKIYANRLVIWDYDSYFMKPVIAELTPQQVSKWSYQSTMQGVYTGVEVSFTNSKTKKTVTAIVGTGERLYRTTQRADSEADAQLIGRGILAKTNRSGNHADDHAAGIGYCGFWNHWG